MNCPQCQYLLWELREPRCPECGLAFETTDFSFRAGAVHFLCNDCGQPYVGDDDNGLPYPRNFTCVHCHHPVEASRMAVRPLVDDAHGDPLRIGTPWEHRYRVGYFRAFIDGVSRLTTQPGEFFRRCYGQDAFGAAVFSILCAYGGASVFLFMVYLLGRCGLLGPFTPLTGLLRPRVLMVLIIALPVMQIVWTYAYSYLIQGVLWALGNRPGDVQRTVHAVAFSSAVLPALFSLPPIGLPWYVAVVSSGVEHLQQTPWPRALLAAGLPMLAALNLALVACLVLF